MAFDPSGVGRKGQLFGFPYKELEADLIILPVPWDVTVSYHDGAGWGPAAILEASPQLDFSIPGVKTPWKYKTVMSAIENEWVVWGERLRDKASFVIESLEDGAVPNQGDLNEVNQGCEELVNHIRALSHAHLAGNRLVGIVGGDHSAPLGLMQALAEKEKFGILQIDAHMDLRVAYEGFTYSHASIMYNAMKVEGIVSLTQVGIRDYCEEEENYIEQSSKDITTFFDQDLQGRLLNGRPWAETVEEIIDSLPQELYISLDIDGLDPSLCPNTGTPVPGGLTFPQLDYLLRQLARSGKRIVGFDLCEVSPGVGDWDANVGARVLYLLATYSGLSRGTLQWSDHS